MPGAGELLVSSEEIGTKVRELGARINEDYRGQDLVLVGVRSRGVPLSGREPFWF